jgi:hypothetical protein
MTHLGGAEVQHVKSPGKDDQPVPEWAEGLVLLLTVYPDARVATKPNSGVVDIR